MRHHPRLAAIVSMAGLLASGPAEPMARSARAPDGPAPRASVAILPFTARAASAGAWPVVRSALREALEAHGFDPIDDARVAEALRERRLRDVSLLRTAEIRELSEALEARFLLQGAIERFDTAPAAASLSARVIDPRSGTVETAGFSVVDAHDLLGPLGSGGPVEPARVARAAARDLAAQLAGRRARRLTARLAPQPAGFLSPRLAKAPPRRLVVLPFRSRVERPGAGPAAADLATWCLRGADGATLIDAGDAVRRLLDHGWRTGLPLDREAVLLVGKEAGAAAVLMGSVARWQEEAAGERRPCEVALSLRLLDATDGEVLWAAEHERRGDQTRLLYDAGYVRHSEELAGRALCEALAPLIALLEKPDVPSQGDPP